MLISELLDSIEKIKNKYSKKDIDVEDVEVVYETYADRDIEEIRVVMRFGKPIIQIVARNN